jgi:predicted DsbA family dithiol-disulfide isomerase
MSTATTPLRIDLVSDVVCPWCIIGFTQLQRALTQLGDEVEVDLHWHPFELALFESNFSRGENVDDPEVLAGAAGRAGLDEDGARAVLHDGRYVDTVREEQRFWLSKGIHAVPSFILDGRYLIPGAQDPEVFVAALRRLLDEKAA